MSDLNIEEDESVLAAANSYTQKYYLNKLYSSLPASILEELQKICVAYVEEVGGIAAYRFAEDGELSLISIPDENDFYYDEISARLEEEGFAPDNVRISAYINDMPAQLSACDLTISRSGALSVAEVTMAGRAAIFIPSPNVTADHQYYNAKAVEDAGGAIIVRENADTAGKVMEEVKKLDSDRSKLEEMKKASRSIAPVSATDIIYRTVTQTCK